MLSNSVTVNKQLQMKSGTFLLFVPKCRLNRNEVAFIETEAAQEHSRFMSLLIVGITQTADLLALCELRGLALVLRFLIEALWYRYLFLHQSVFRSFQSEKTWKEFLAFYFLCFF